MKQLRPWTRFLLRGAVVSAVALVVFLSVFLLADRLLPHLTGWLMSGDPSDSFAALATVVEDFGAWGVAGLGTTVVFWLLGPWADQARPQVRQVENAAEAKQQVTFGLIPSPAWCFQHRPGDQTRIADALASDGVRVVALEGERGVGKTQLAADQARTSEAAGVELVAWINAEQGLVPELARLADKLGLRRSPTESDEQLAGYARQHLETRDGDRRFVVFDNVSDPAQLRPYLPSVGTAKVLITTNRRELATMAGVTAIRVETYNPAQGLAFLSSATGLVATEDARRVGEALGWLPLGLAQAAAYIRQNSLDYARYVAQLTTQRLDATLAQQAGADHPGVLGATKLSLEGLVRDDPSGLSLRLLTVLSTLSPDGVGRAHLLPGEAAAFGADADLRAALGFLSGSSLVTVTAAGAGEQGSDTARVVVHRLTARIVRFEADRGHDAGLRSAVATATSLLVGAADGIPVDGVARRRSDLDELVAHVDALRGYAPTDPALLRLAARVGALLGSAGDLSHAITLLESTYASYREQARPDDPVTLSTANTLAGAYLAAGRGAQAVDLYSATLAARERALGPADRDTLTSRNNLARAYAGTGRTAEAITLHEATLAAREHVLGASDPDTLTSRNDLANALRASGQVEPAIAAHEAALAGRERALGPEHPDTLTSRNDLAVDLRSAGQAGRAVALHSAVLATRERVLGAEHPDTLASLSDLGSAYRADGQYRRAIALHEQVLAVRERVLGPDHPETLASRNNLAASLEQKGRLRRALKVYRAALADCVRVLGGSSAETRAVRSNVDRTTKARKRQRVRRALVGATAGVAVVGCLVGATLYSLGVAIQEAEDAARTTQVVTPATLAGRAPFIDDPALTRSLASDQRTLESQEDVDAAVVAAFGRPGVDLVYVEAISLPLPFPDQELASLLGEEPRTRMHDVDAGPLGGVAACGTEVVDIEGTGHEFAACRWVDQASTGHVIWYNQPVGVAESEFLGMRAAIEVSRAG